VTDRAAWLYVYRDMRGLPYCQVAHGEPLKITRDARQPLWHGPLPPHLRHRSLDEIADWWAIAREMGEIA
jgi:hypothetical protein